MDDMLEKVTPATTVYSNEITKFLNSTSAVDISVFFFITLVIMVILLQVIIYIFSSNFVPSESPTLINGMISGTEVITITQDPSLKRSIPIKRSTNNDGISFTWSTWLNIANITHQDDEGNRYMNIFHKGDGRTIQPTSKNNDMSGISEPNNAPGMYIERGTNNIAVIMNTHLKIYDMVILRNIPINKWFNIVIRVSKQHTMDIYINGKLVNRHILRGVPKQNYGNVHVGGFDGYISSLRYFASELSAVEINDIAMDGPNLTPISNDSDSATSPTKGGQYLALQWFLSGQNY